MNPVTLHDGTVVDSSSEAWRAECEARHVLRMPGYDKREGMRVMRVSAKQARRDYLARVEAKRGAESREALEAAVWALYEAETGRRRMTG